MTAQQSFGGDWTQDKLERVRNYLVAYATIMNKQKFRFAYIDAFAGTGYREIEDAETAESYLFPELNEEEPQSFIEGSARIALQVEPEFDKYVFIESNPEAVVDLERLREEFSEKATKIQIESEDANEWLIQKCDMRRHGKFWKRNRAVVFLDPYGMQVRWETMEAIARTQAIDSWVLFPLGIAVNRLLKRDGEINQGWKKRLDNIFGTDEWFDIFYESTKDLFGKERHDKIASLEDIGRYYNDRLKAIFAGVAENPLPLYNSRGNPLYLLCFAAANPKGAKTAIRIAQYILDQ